MTDREFLYCIIGGPLGALAVWGFFFILFTFGG
jgi:hypothetical protein